MVDQTVNAELVNVRTVAEMLGCSVRSVFRLADSRKMPRPIRLGSLVKWRKATILDWIAGGCLPCRKGGR